jgi:hypothetical protein
VGYGSSPAKGRGFPERKYRFYCAPLTPPIYIEAGIPEHLPATRID